MAKRGNKSNKKAVHVADDEVHVDNTEISDNAVIITREMQKTRRAQIYYDGFIALGKYVIWFFFLYIIIETIQNGTVEMVIPVLKSLTKDLGYVIAWSLSGITGGVYLKERKSKKRAIRKIDKLRKIIEENDPENGSSKLIRYIIEGE